MGNKKVYISPAIKVVYMEAAQPIAASNDGGGLDNGGPAKEHDTFWDNFWGDEEDGESSMSQQPKSLW